MEQSDNILSTFFDRTFERCINEKMFYRDYAFPEEDVMAYAESILAVPMNRFVAFIRENCCIPYLEFNDIVQFSSLYDATVGIVTVLENNGDEGFTFIDIGRMLLDDGKVRNDMAYRKYGENHAKTAKEFGLTQILFCKTYLTCIGKILNHFDVFEQQKLLRRLILRNRYVELIIKISASEKISIDSQMGLLSESTRIRRRSNVIKIWQLIIEEDKSITEALSNVIV